MARVKRGTTVKQKHKKVLDRAKGFLGRHHSGSCVENRLGVGTD